ncbi:alpha/beta fold hydrolase [Reyranella sp. CPCC 100927]|uniref:alpha/beta fold hydrolase n=1 Tax=Reyranella sp. CPCC 100927 TaxID=2599616 RepID=UPI0011B55811|nr:alpha/beta fold hydrolase [Reyranella sp. CPCC 100927]TWS96601.1 alpha/beta fold hydrolase [Reyranella sp. CPCC 100927]
MEPMMFEGPRGAIAYRESGGRGRPVVLVHGNSASMRAFERQMSAPLGQALRLIAIDLPGHGRSADAHDASGYGLPAYADVLVAFASDRGLQDAIFVGWSLGGHIILEAVPALPQARGFMIFGTPPLGFPPAMDKAFLPNPAMGLGFAADITRSQAQQYVESFFRPGWSDIPASFVDDVMRTDGRARAELAAGIVPGGYRDEIEVVANLDRPLAVLHGAREQLVNGTYFETLRMPTLWRQSVQVLPDAGHAPQWEDAVAFNTLLAAFVADVG